MHLHIPRRTNAQDNKHQQPVQPSNVGRNGEEGVPRVSTSVLATATYPAPTPPRDIRPPAPTGLEGAPAQNRSAWPEEAPHQQRQMSAQELDLMSRALLLKTKAVMFMIEPFDASDKLRCGSRCAVPAWLVGGAAGVVTGLGGFLWHASGNEDASGVNGAEIALMTSVSLFLGLGGACLAGVPGAIQKAHRIARESEALLAEAKLIMR